MFFKEWEILLVDDDPDLLQISTLAMKNFNIYGLPLNIHTARSKAEALELLHSRPEIQWGLAVAFIDVVMESDSAGLELCEAVRALPGKKITQLYIRTGQPGIAPERTVIDQYDINGYFTKAEVSEEKLYSLVRSGVRQFFWSTILEAVLTFHELFLATAGSREELTKGFQMFMQRLDAGVGVGFKRCYMTGGSIIELSGLYEATARAMIAELDQQPGTPLGDNGDKVVAGDDGFLLLKAAAQPGRAESFGLMQTAFEPPITAVALVNRMFAGLGTAWHHAS